MKMYDENYNFEETRAQLGIGAGLYVKDSILGKFIIRLLAEKIPSCSGDVETVEIDVTTSRKKSKLNGKETLSDVEFEVFAHRDNMRILESMANKTFEFMSISGDFTGERYAGTLTYKVNERTSGDPVKATVKITPIASYGYVDDATPLIAETAKIIGDVPYILDLDTTLGTVDVDIVTNPSDATIAAVSETVAVCTAKATGKKITITGVKEGTSIVEITSTKADCASMKRTILVRVPKA